jgi:hypothetical protein
MEAQGLIRRTRNNPPSFGTLRQHGLDPLVTQRDMVRVSFFEPCSSHSERIPVTSM